MQVVLLFLIAFLHLTCTIKILEEARLKAEQEEREREERERQEREQRRLFEEQVVLFH